MPVDMHWNHSHPWKVDHAKKCFYKIFFWNTLKALTRVDFLNSMLLSLPVLCCLPFCMASLVPVGKQQKNQDIAGASSEAGLHSCMCENLVLVEVALHDCSDFSIVTAGTSGVLWSSLLLEGALSQPLHEVKHSFIQPAALKQPSMKYPASEQPVPVLSIHILQERWSAVPYAAHFQNETLVQTNTQDF